MSSDGVRIERKQRKRSQRNKIVTGIAAVGGIVASVEQTIPGVLPPGSGLLAGQVSSLLAILFNQFWPQ